MRRERESGVSDKKTVKDFFVLYVSGEINETREGERDGGDLRR